MLKVIKFGGSSLANAEQFRKVKNIVDADPARMVVVVSAPGKRFKKDNKITDLLYLSYAHVKYGVDYSGMLSMIRDRYKEIADELGLKIDINAFFVKIEEDIRAGASEDYLVSRGEWLCAQLMAEYLGYDFVDSFGNVFFAPDGSIDQEKTYEALKLSYNESKGRIVVPGFFGTMPGGELALMSRGGSDITGALLAAALNADIYENWTDVPGILMADPSIVKDPYPIPRITYDELRELTYMGAKVLHEASVLPVKEAGIPVNIRDTNMPDEPGTLIADSFSDDDIKDDKFYITGITGKKSYTQICVMQDNLSVLVENLRAVLKIFSKYKVPVEQVSSGVDEFSITCPTAALRQFMYMIFSEIEELTGRGTVRVTDGISLIACVSRRMVLRPGISGMIFGTLGENNINIRLISQGARELSIFIGVDDANYDKTVQVLYDSFTRRA